MNKLKWFGDKAIEVQRDESWPKISIVTPSFNQGQFIEATILSILNQGYPNLEYIIIDGGSTDNTVEIIKKYEKYISYWISETDNGQTDAINKGFEKCTGEIFNWLNSDDIMMPNALFTITKHFIENENVSCVTGLEDRFINDKIVNRSFGTSIESTIEETITKAHIDQPSTFFRKNSIHSVFPLHEGLKYCMDSYLWINYLILNGQNNCIQIEEALIYFRYHDDSKTVKWGLNFEAELNRILLSLLGQFDIIGKKELHARNWESIKMINLDDRFDTNSLSNLIKSKVLNKNSSIDQFYYRYASHYLALNLKKNGRSYLFKAIKSKPLKLVYWKAYLKTFFYAF